jgi:hypothetical protein
VKVQCKHKKKAKKEKMPNRQSCDASCVTQKRKERNTPEKIEEKPKK